MIKPVETELKLRLTDPQQWTRLLASPWLRELSGGTAPVSQNLSSIYFDTPDLKLHRCGIAYRLRQEQDRWTATVKAGGSTVAGLHQRDEWNLPAPGPKPDPALFRDTSIGPIILQVVNSAALVPLFTTRFERYTLNLHTADGDQVELAVDRGEIEVKNCREPILEVELELKSGRPAALLALGAALSRQFPLLLENRSKYHRALQLAGLATTMPGTHPSPPRVIVEEEAAAALSRLLVYQLQYLVAAQDWFLTVPAEPESLHQLLVHLKHLQALWSFCQPLVRDGSYATRQEELRHWDHQMRSARDLDVLLAAWQEATASGILTGVEKSPLADLLVNHRQAAVDRLHRVLASGSLTPLLLGLWAWLAEDGLRPDPAASITVDHYVRWRLGQWSHDLLQNGQGLSLTDAFAVQRLYISGKKLCYILESLGEAFPKHLSKFAEQLKSLQNILELLQDTRITAALLNTVLGKRPSRALCREAGMLIGWQAGRSLAAQEKFFRRWRRVVHLGRKLAKTETATPD